MSPRSCHIRDARQFAWSRQWRYLIRRIGLSNRVSPAKDWLDGQNEFQSKGREVQMQRMKRTGPRTEPCGTPILSVEVLI